MQAWSTMASPEPSQLISKLLSPRRPATKSTIAELKMKMTKKLDRLVDESNTKEDKLRVLREELEMLQGIDNRDKATIIRVKHEVEVKKKDYYSPERLFQGKIGDQILDVAALRKAYDYTSVESIAEKKEVLVNKIHLTEQRLIECETMNEQYEGMITKLWRESTIDDKLIHHELVNKHNNMDHILESLNDLNMIENNRVLQINNMEFQYTKTISIDQKKMDSLLEERRVILANHVTDTQGILYNLLKHLRQIKMLNIELEKFHGKRERYAHK